MTDVAENKDGLTEEILNIVFDEIDDIIMIHDSEHTVVWMNRAGRKVFSRGLDEVIGERCYHLFGRECCCDDCRVSMLVGGNKAHSFRRIPGREECYRCISTPVMKDGEMKLVVQHLKRMDAAE